MSVALRLLQLHTPEFFKKQALRELFEATANAFGREVPSLETQSLLQRLRTYARFTAEQAEEYLQRGEDPASLEARLHRNARRLGQRLRQRFGITRRQEVMAMARILYSIIDIDFEGSPEGDIVIRRCYFSQFYSPRVCELISALDEGLLAGLAGGGKLTFTERITQGCEACKARFLDQPGSSALGQAERLAS